MSDFLPSSMLFLSFILIYDDNIHIGINLIYKNMLFRASLGVCDSR